MPSPQISRRPRTTVLASLAIATIAIGVPAAADAGTRPARSADAFVDSIGVNLHLGYSNTPYRNHELVKDKLVELGVRHIRDGVAPGRPDVYRALRVLASCGIKANLIVGDPLRRYGSGTLEQQLALIKNEVLPAVGALEGPNEYNKTRLDPNWASTLRDYQARLYSLAKADPALSKFPVLAPPLIGAGGHEVLGDISRFTDYGNIHIYPSGGPPDRTSELRRHLDMAAEVSGSKPVQATETGYHNAVNVPRDFGHPAASETAAAVYMPRLYLEYFRSGFTRTFAYELVDEWPDDGRVNSEANFGLLRNDFSEKPAFTAVKRLIRLLRDPGPRFKPQRLAYRIESAPADVHELLLQKRDGSFYLALWREDASSTDEARITLGRRARQIEVYRPSEAAQPRQRRSNVRSLELRLSSSVAIVKVARQDAVSSRSRKPRRGPRRARS